MIRTYKFRLLPRKAQHVKLRAALDHSRDLYNAALEERISCYRLTGKPANYFAQTRGVTELRTDPAYTGFSVSMQHWPLRRVDDAFKAFFRRVKTGEKPGYPRFRGKQFFKTFGFADRSGWKIDGARLRMKGVGCVRIHMHRRLPSQPMYCSVKLEAEGWVVLLACEVPVEAQAATGRSIGLDLGLASFFATSDGQTIPAFHAAKRAEREIRRRQRAMSRCKRGSSGRRRAKSRVALAHVAVANARRTFHHQLAARLVRENDMIAIENLNVRALARGMLAKSVRDAGWTSFTNILTEKAEKAARTVVRVDPNYTSQICPECGIVKKKELSERVHRCECGCVLDRDVAAARVILSRAVTRPVVPNLEVA